MHFATSKSHVQELLTAQLTNNFLLDPAERAVLKAYFEEALQRCEYCFSHMSFKYYQRQGEPFFNPYHSVQYMTFLYYLAHTIYQKSPTGSLLCDKLYYLNKMLNGVDIFYIVRLPDFFTAEHPVGTVIGKAEIGNGLHFYQGCTIGGFHRKDGGIDYPVIGENVKLYANSSVIGACRIGSNVKIGAGTIIKNQDIPDRSIVFGQSPDLIIKHLKS